MDCTKTRFQAMINLMETTTSKRELSDGFHTFEELYDHRCLLFLNFCLLLPKYATAWKADPKTPGWFLLYAELKAGQVSYHLPNKFLYLISGAIRELPDYQWDGHTSEITLARLEVTAEDLNRRQRSASF